MEKDNVFLLFCAEPIFGKQLHYAISSQKLQQTSLWGEGIIWETSEEQYIRLRCSNLHTHANIQQAGARKAAIDAHITLWCEI